MRVVQRGRFDFFVVFWCFLTKPRGDEDSYDTDAMASAGDEDSGTRGGNQKRGLVRTHD